MGYALIYGAEGRSLQADRIASSSGTISWSTDLPFGTQGARSLSVGGGGFVRIPLVKPISGTKWRLRMSFRQSSQSGTANVLFVGLNDGSTNNNGVGVSKQNTTWRWTTKSGTTELSASVDASTTTYGVMTIDVDQQVGGSIVVTLDGVQIMSHTFTSGDLSGITMGNSLLIRSAPSIGTIIDDVIILDPDTAGPTGISEFLQASVRDKVQNGAGNYSEWSGSHTDINARPFNPANWIRATAPGQRIDFTGTNRPAGYSVVGIQVSAYLGRIGTDAGDEILAYKREDGSDTESDAIPCPELGSVAFIIDPPSDVHADATTYGLRTADSV